jgi:hypothetical protein
MFGHEAESLSSSLNNPILKLLKLLLPFIVAKGKIVGWNFVSSKWENYHASLGL